MRPLAERIPMLKATAIRDNRQVITLIHDPATFNIISVTGSTIRSPHYVWFVRRTHEFLLNLKMIYVSVCGMMPDMVFIVSPVEAAIPVRCPQRGQPPAPG